MFIAFDGPDGAGKTTLIEKLAAKLNGRGYFAKAFRAPGYTEAGKHIRHMILEDDAGIELNPDRQFIMMATDYLLTLSEIMKFRKERKGIALMDRYFISGLIYQSKMYEYLNNRTRFNGGASLALLANIIRSEILIAPDLYVLVTADNNVLHERQGGRIKDGQFEEEAKAIAIRKAYNEFLSLNDIPEIDYEATDLSKYQGELSSLEFPMCYMLNNTPTARDANIHTLVEWIDKKIIKTDTIVYNEDEEYAKDIVDDGV